MEPGGRTTGGWRPPPGTVPPPGVTAPPPGVTVPPPGVRVPPPGVTTPPPGVPPTGPPPGVRGGMPGSVAAPPGPVVLVAFALVPFTAVLMLRPLGVRAVPAAKSASRGATVELSICGSSGVTLKPESLCASPVNCSINSSGVRSENRLMPNCSNSHKTNHTAGQPQGECGARKEPNRKCCRANRQLRCSKAMNHPQNP